MTEIRRCQTDSGPPVRTKMPGYLAVPGNGDALTGNVGAWSRPDSRAPSFSAVASDSVKPTQEAEPMCSRNPWRTVRKDNKLLTFKPDCMCWGCDECRPKLKEKWIWHATKVLGQGGYLGAVTVDPDEFASFARQLRRRGGNYFRVRISKHGYAVIVGMPTNPAWWTFRATPLKTHQALELFTKWVNEIQDSRGGNPISSSRSWALPSREHSDWDLIAIGPAPSAVRSAAFLALTDFVERNIWGTPVAICSGDTDKIDRLCDLIESLASGNPKAKKRHHADLDSEVIGIALEDFEPCGDEHYSGRVLVT